MSVALTINGELATLSDITPTTTLLEWLREHRGLTATKEGCAEGDCGACSVIVIDPLAEGGASPRTVNACLIFVASLHGCTVFTAEHLADAAHPVTAALIDNAGSQCGYCTPGFAMALTEACHRTDITTPAKEDDQLCGNLCRCTGYRPQRASLQALAGSQPDDAVARAMDHAESAAAVDLSNENRLFLQPPDEAALFQAMAQHKTRTIVAGGTDVGLQVTMHGAAPQVVISLQAIPSLRQLNVTGQVLTIGACTPLSDLEQFSEKHLPVLANALAYFGSRQIKNRATLGGNLVNASPIGDTAPILLALDATIIVSGPLGERQIPIADWFVEYRKTALADNEIVKAVRLNIPPQTAHTAYYKVSKRRELDISTVAGAFHLQVQDGQIAYARVAYGGMAATPIRAEAVEQHLVGRPFNESTIAQAVTLLGKTLTPLSDHRGSAGYRAQLADNLLLRFFLEHSAQFPTQVQLVGHPNQASATASPLVHRHAALHPTGQAKYVEDLGAQSGALHCALATANIARATILSLNTEQAAAAPGVKLVLTAADLPHAKLWGTLIADEPLLADDQIHYNGQPIALIVADTRAHAEAAAARVHAEYAPLPPVLSIDAAIKAGSYHGTAHTIQRGDVAQAIDAADHIITGTLLTPAQDHFYLETQATLASPDDNGDLTLLSSTQHPTEVQHLVSAVTGLPYHRVNCETPRMGGGFGGKESQAAPFAALAGLAAHTLGVPVLIRLNRHQDMVITGKRHTFHSQYRIGFSNAGKILGFQATLTADGGHSTDLSPAILDRALFHLDNAYTIPALKFEGRVAKSNLPSATAFRGFGGPQGVAVIEEAINRFCEETGRDSAEVRHLNYYSDAQNITPYGQPINDCRLSTIHDQLLTSSGYTDRKKAIALFNATSPVIKRGIAYQPVKFGISFTVSMLNQAGALVVIYTDGSVQVNTGGTEMGQGLTTKMAVIAARSLGITDDRVRVMPTTTEKVPNTSPTAASSGTDLNGAAVRAAVATLLDRLRPVAAKMLNVAPSAITIADNVVSAGDQSIPFSALCKAAWAERVSLSATGFYATPGIAYDRDAGKGTPFRYFAYGGSVVEVELDGLTGEHRLRRVDILHDVGDSLAPEIDRGQVEGAFVQGLGWLTCEELLYNDDGRVLTAGPSTYKIPSFGDIPHNFRVDLLENATNDLAVMGSKAVGEPPFILAIGAVSALRQAIHAFAPTRGAVDLSLPATPEALLNAIYAHQTGE